jgi:hypothetical protein
MLAALNPLEACWRPQRVVAGVLVGADSMRIWAVGVPTYITQMWWWRLRCCPMLVGYFADAKVPGGAAGKKKGQESGLEVCMGLTRSNAPKNSAEYARCQYLKGASSY